MQWETWRFQALLRLERGEPLFRAFATSKQQARYRKRFLQELYDEYLIEPGKWGPRITDAGRAVCSSWRQRNGLEPFPLKYDERQCRIIMGATYRGANVMLAERFGTTPGAIKQFKRRLRLKIAARGSDGQASSPSNY